MRGGHYRVWLEAEEGIQHCSFPQHPEQIGTLSVKLEHFRAWTAQNLTFSSTQGETPEERERRSKTSETALKNTTKFST
jgi:hypothetical protein